MKGLPTSVRVGAYKIAIVLTPESDMNEALGDFTLNSRRIRLMDDLTGALLADALIHEITHAIWNIGGLTGKQAEEEQAAQVMGAYWAQVYRDNPKLIAWLVEQAQKG